MSQGAAPGPFGIADATARTLVNGIASNPRLSSSHAFVTGMRHGYERLAAPARATAVTEAVAWMERYTNSPAFSTVYAAAKQRAKPAGQAPEEMTVDAELKQKLDEKRKDIEESKQRAALLPEKDRPELLAMVKQLEDMFNDPATIKSMRDEIEERRAGSTDAAADLFKHWNDTYPPTVRDFVKSGLQQFLAAATRADLSVPVTPFKSPTGAIAGFVAPIERPPGSWIEIECMLAGRSMVAAAQTAVEAWLREVNA